MASFMLGFPVLSLPFHWQHSRCESSEQCDLPRLCSLLAPNASIARKCCSSQVFQPVASTTVSSQTVR